MDRKRKESTGERLKGLTNIRIDHGGHNALYTNKTCIGNDERGTEVISRWNEYTHQLSYDLAKGIDSATVVRLVGRMEVQLQHLRRYLGGKYPA